MSLKLWTANRLLMKGWELITDRTYDSWSISDQESSLFGTVPAPRVLQNQLDRNLASYMAKQEGVFLKELQKAMSHQTKAQWIDVFLAAVILLHIRERDLWRLEHWVVHQDEVSF